MSIDRDEALMREGLVHKYAGMKDEDFFRLIDETGGWPVGYEWVGFAHSDRREAGFTHSPIHHGWWTTLNHADDYYLWKISAKGLQRIADSVHSAMRVTRPDAAHITFRDWRNGIAATQKPEVKAK